MAKLTYLSEVKHNPNTVLTVGTFDGVHKGHQALINTVAKKAIQQKYRSVIVTFDPHPRDIITPGSEGIQLLTTLPERCQRMETHGVNLMVVIPFTRDFSLKSSEEFVREELFNKVGIREFVIGYDHHFGKDREGSIETVKRLGKELGFDTHIISKREVGDTTVSSTKIRNILSEEGNVKLAAKMLGWKYTLQGTVVKGDQRGKKLGFPTANIHPEHHKKVIPAKGVYAVECMIDEKKIGGMMNIGFRPTFNDLDQRTLEVHLFNFDDDIYGKVLKVEFIEKIRDEKKFNSKEELIAQLKHDKKIAQECLK